LEARELLSMSDVSPFLRSTSTATGPSPAVGLPAHSPPHRVCFPHPGLPFPLAGPTLPSDHLHACLGHVATVPVSTSTPHSASGACPTQRPPIPPFRPLWLYATLDGITSALRLDELLPRLASPTIGCALVSRSTTHTCPTFRVDHLDSAGRTVHRQTLACFHHEGLIALESHSRRTASVRAAPPPARSSFAARAVLTGNLSRPMEYLRHFTPS